MKVADTLKCTKFGNIAVYPRCIMETIRSLERSSLPARSFKCAPALLPCSGEICERYASYAALMPLRNARFNS